LGELFAGIILGPFALGSLQIQGQPLIALNEHVIAFAEIGAILILFVAGLEVEFGHFRGLATSSLLVGAFGVIVPFFLGLYVVLLSPLPPNDLGGALLVASALTATSIAITMRTLEEYGRLDSSEGRLMINAAVIDDVLALAVLTIVISIVQTGVTPSIAEVAFVLASTLGIWLLLLLSVIFIGSKFVNIAERFTASGAIEVFATSLCFGSAALAAAIGLHPIVGAFAAGMAIAESRVLVRVRDYIAKINLIFSPIFFAVIGAQLNLFGLTELALLGAILLTVIAIVSKLVGCGVPAYLLTRDGLLAKRVGAGMISRGEVGLIVAGLALTSGSIGQDVYAQIIAMAMLTTIITPLLLRWLYRSRPIQVPIEA
jgi:Kef-type K+ transport system membrane component KefB